MAGIKCHESLLDFDWPSKRDLEALPFSNQIPSLTKVRIKGLSCMEGIQFEFNNGGIVSPFLEASEDEPHSAESTCLESPI